MDMPGALADPDSPKGWAKSASKVAPDDAEPDAEPGPDPCVPMRAQEAEESEKCEDAALVIMPCEEKEMENAGGRAAGKLWVDIWAATGLGAADRGGRSRPYVSVSLLGLPAGASVAHATLKTP